MNSYFTTALACILLTACNNDFIVSEPSIGENISYTGHPKNELYQSQLEKYWSETNSPGSIMVIDRLGEQIWIGTEGYSNLSFKRDFKTEDQFRTGSITKMFVAVAILQLVEDGRLDLNDRLSELLPFTAGNIPNAELITVRQLLAHMSGIIDPPNESLRYQADILNNPEGIYNASLQEIYKQYVFGKPLKFSPGSGYSYSNTNFWLLGNIVESLAGKSLQAQMQDKIFNPLGMTRTYISKLDDRNVVRGYSDMYGNGVLFDVSIFDRAEGDGKPAGGLVSTARDLQQFMRGLFSGELIGTALLQDMKTIQWSGCDNPNCEYGLGLEVWRTGAGTAYGHNGALIGIEANALYFEETGNISVLYKNNGNGSNKSWLDELMK